MANGIRNRLGVHNLSDAQVPALRDAYVRMMRITDNRGYAFLAGLHGAPSWYCWHHQQNARAAHGALFAVASRLFTTMAPRTTPQFGISMPAIDFVRLNHSMTFLPDRPPQLSARYRNLDVLQSSHTVPDREFVV
jgi:hypothetical protein